ncbi:MAG TPA: aminotransferase class I/II-fold pyridoxal phosphate-dependent enzyme [Gemmatimonadaceae bacterium]|jgi:aspartate aminotransferase|nr:aminotransferase class I/II-fold pyridoxal phosphate-dependent enzyme [Gemmatimonadaceae bacterium]
MTELRLSTLAGSLLGSEILKIAADVRALTGAGHEICNLTVGDFSPSEFRIPEMVESGIVEGLRRGETNYPPSDGILPLREAVRTLYRRELGIDPALASVIVTSGSRPGIYATYRALVDPGDRVVYPTPSWNNPYYVQLVGARPVPVPCDAASRFMPTRASLEDAVRDARLLVLCSPQNPAGTVFTEEALGGICDLVLEENARRGATERPLFVMFDQVYWTLTFGRAHHVHPVQLRPAMAPYTIYVDGASKSLAATGIRVGWIVAPPDLAAPMSALVGHMGAWAPKAEQGAVAAFLTDGAAFAAYRAELVAQVRARLDALFIGLAAMRDEGLPVEVIAPEGAIYLSARFALFGHVAPDGTRLDSDEAVRAYLLREAGLAVVPLRAFGSLEDTEWHRLSVGAVSIDEIARVLPRVRAALMSAAR